MKDYLSSLSFRNSSKDLIFFISKLDPSFVIGLSSSLQMENRVFELVEVGELFGYEESGKLVEVRIFKEGRDWQLHFRWEWIFFQDSEQH